MRKAWALVYDYALVYITPKKKTMLRATIISMIAMLPMYVLLFIRAPFRMSLFFAAVM